MKIAHLQYFVSLANSTSINQAAQDLHFSQQQLNRIVTALENEMQVQLFVRSNKGITLTDDGRMFLKYAKNILGEYYQMQNYFSIKRTAVPLQEQAEGRCTLTIPPFIALFLSDLIGKFKEVAPRIKLFCEEITTAITTEMLLEEKLHLLTNIVAQEVLDEAEGQIITEKICASTSYLCCNKWSALSKKDYVTEEECSEYLSTVTPFAPRGTYREENVIFSSANIYQHLDSVAQNGTICALPDFVLAKAKALYPDVKMVPFRDGLENDFFVVYPKSYRLSKADEILISFLKLYMQNLQLTAKQSM